MNHKKLFYLFVIILSGFLLFNGCNKPESPVGKPTAENQNGVVTPAPTEILPEPKQEEPTAPVTATPGVEESAEIDKPIQQINGLVLVEEIDPNIAVELRYATTNNFTKQKVYPLNICVLQRQTSEKLAKANA